LRDDLKTVNMSKIEICTLNKIIASRQQPVLNIVSLGGNEGVDNPDRFWVGMSEKGGLVSFISMRPLGFDEKHGRLLSGLPDIT